MFIVLSIRYFHLFFHHIPQVLHHQQIILESSAIIGAKVTIFYVVPTNDAHAYWRFQN